MKLKGAGGKRIALQVGSIVFRGRRRLHLRIMCTEKTLLERSRFTFMDAEIAPSRQAMFRKETVLAGG